MIKLNILVILLTLLVATEALGFGNDQEFKPKNNLILNPGGQVDFSAAADLQGNSILNAVFDSDLNTLTNIVNADVKSTAAIDRTKIASGTANYVLINNGSGVFSEEQFLNKTRGGTGITSTATFPASGTISVIDATEDLSNKTFTDSITLTEIASPGTPAASDKFFFCKSDDKCYFKNDAASEVEISTGAHTAASTNNITNITTVYTALLTDDTIIATSGAADYDVDLPTAVGNTGKVFTIIKDYTAFVLGVDGNGAELVNIHPSFNLGIKGSYVKIMSDGAKWVLLSSYNPIYSRYNTTAGQSIPSGVQTRVDYGTLFAESHAGWTVTGAGVWSFTADMEGQYNIRIGSLFALQSWNVGSVALPIINKNNTNTAYAMPYYVTYTGNQSYGNNGFIKVNLAVGDTIWTEILQNDGFAKTLDVDAIGNFIEITAEF